MNESITKTTQHFSARASLAAIGIKLKQVDLFGPVRQMVHIAQKTVKHTPIDKVYDGFIAILAGAHGLVEINTRLRSDAALQAAFGRTSCAEQSVVQETLDACTAENVVQMEQAVQTIYRQHSQGYQHDYTADWQILDVDMSGMPCGPKAAFATKGYFAKQRNRRGRQLGRVLASRYDEVVVDQLFSGNTQLTKALQPLLEAAEQTLDLDEGKRQRTIVRIDAGGGSLGDVNWALAQGRPGCMARIIRGGMRGAWLQASSRGSTILGFPVDRSVGSPSQLRPMCGRCVASLCAVASRMGNGRSAC